MSPIQTRARARRENATPQSGLTPTRKTARQETLKALKRRNTFFIQQAGREQAILVDRTARVNVARQAKERRKTTFHPIIAKWTDEDSLPKKSATLHPEPINLTRRVRWAPRVGVLSMSSEIAPDKLRTPAHSSGSKPLRPILIFRDPSPVKQSDIEGPRQDQPAEYARGRLVGLKDLEEPPSKITLRSRSRSRSLSRGRSLASDIPLTSGASNWAPFDNHSPHISSCTGVPASLSAEPGFLATARFPLRPTVRISREKLSGRSRDGLGQGASDFSITTCPVRTDYKADLSRIVPPTVSASQAQVGFYGKLTAVDRCLLLLTLLYIPFISLMFGRMFGLW